MSAPNTPIHGWTLFWDGGRMSTYYSGERQPGAAVVVGETVTVDGPIATCERGLHGSERLLDALTFAPCERPTIGYCRFEGDIARDTDKLAAASRTVLWLLDEERSEAVLRTHARWSALAARHLWGAPNVAVRYLVTGDESFRAAAWAAAWAAARDAAWAAGRAAAWAAASAATSAAAWAAASAAARAAARAAAWAAGNAELERLAWCAHRGEPVELAIPETARAIVDRVMDGAA